MRHLDLFSGIGGFALAVDKVWTNAEHIFCEIDPYCQKLLKLRFPESEVFGDIRTLTADSYYMRQEKQELKTTRDKQCDRGIDLLTGGFPCQPFSQAGQRRGTKDDRFLWPEMLRVISEFKPTWIIGENVAGILSMAEFQSESEVASETDLFGNFTDIHTKRGRGILYRIIGELEQIGYSVQTFIIPACAVNAPHRRDRVWIVAHNGTRDSRQGDAPAQRSGQCSIERRETASASIDGGCGDGRRIETTRHIPCGHIQTDCHAPDTELIGNTESTGLPCGINGQGKVQYGRASSASSWSRNWLEVATELCRMDDGLPVEMDGLKLSKSQHRVERLKALGNSIVPQVAVNIMLAIKGKSK